MKKYNEYKKLDLPEVCEEILAEWEQNKVFEQSVSTREGKTPYVFYEGPPSANGLPGIHHVMARTIKDIFCRYKTLKGFQVKRKAGWDTHGLPVELGVEKTLGITKEDIGKKISIEEYNRTCRTEVMKYTDIWNDLTRKMGYWVDMEHPYITYENTYIESVWYLLQKLYKNGFMYKGYTIQPYSPAAGTGLSTHELNQPGTYRDVKDLTATAMFKITDGDSLNTLEGLFNINPSSNPIHLDSDEFTVAFLAWTTTPWTLPSNTALAVGPNIDYSMILTYNQYSQKPCVVILATDLIKQQFDKKYTKVRYEDIANWDSNSQKLIPYFVFEKNCKGSQLEGLRYEQLLPYALPFENAENAFQVIPGDFVTTEDGTGIVHIAPTFGADDMRVAKAAGVPPMLVRDDNGHPVPLVDLKGRFRQEMADPEYGLAGEYVKTDYLTEEEKEADFQKQKELLKAIIPNLPNYLSVDERLVIKMQQEDKLFKKEKYEHSYPHCWRTDKPVLYYPLDSWFVKTTAMKDRMVELNKKINWKPASTGTGRFGNWLENLQDWNLSRSRYWGIPIPVWTSEDKSEQLCIGSAEELKAEIDKAVQAGFMEHNPLDKFVPGDFSKENYALFDLHRPYVDEVILVSPSGQKLYREADLIDVWFDSGSMPYAQLHYPFENKELIDQKQYYPADFIAEGVDQTRGWFFTLHAIGTMCFDSVAYKNVVSNGLVLDKNGNKMSKRLGNAVDPFETLKNYGADATRWYMISNAQPWDNLRFDLEGIAEIQRKFFGTLYNTYAFFALYANIDGFEHKEMEIPIAERPEIDRWILSMLNSLIKDTDTYFADYEPTKATRAIQEFVNEHLSNWYVRLCRRRFWKGDYTQDKVSAYQTLYKCLEVVSQLASPIAPFFMDRLFNDLNKVTHRQEVTSVHLSDFPKCDEQMIDAGLEERMGLAQKVSSMVLSLRKKENIRVRQPLNKIMIPVLNDHFKEQVEAVKDLILSEVNVKEMEFITETAGIIVKSIKPNFKALGPKYGKQMKAIAAAVNQFGQEDITKIEQDGFYELSLDGEVVKIELSDVEISSEDIPGWLVANMGGLTVALDITINDQLKEEGIARELVNRIQNIRKDKGFEVTDKINLKISRNNALDTAINNNLNYICSETLASSLELVSEIKPEEGILVEVDDETKTFISIDKLN